MCKSFVKPLVANHPGIDSIVHQLPQTKFDLLVELRGNWDTFKYASLHMPNRRFDRGGVRLRNKLSGGQKHETITNFEIIQPLLAPGTLALKPQIYLDCESINFAETFINQNKLDRYAVLHCGARRTLRQWPAKNFAQIANFLIDTYNFQLVFAGTEEDEPVIDEIIKLGKLNAIVCTRNFSLLHFAYLVKKSSLFIGNESGPLHIAAVMGTPLIGIYGPGVKDIFYPIGEYSEVVHHVLDCNPCDQIHCVRPENPCIQLATVMEVKSKIESLIPIN